MTDNGVYVSLDTLQNISDTDKVSSILVKTSESTNDTDSFKNFVDFQNPFCDCHSKLDLCDIFVLKRLVWS